MTGIFPHHNRDTVLFSTINFFTFPYKTITLYGMPFQATSSQRIKLYMVPHVLYISIKNSVCSHLPSFATTNRIEFLSFPPPNKMLHFSGFAFLTECYSEVTWGHIRQSLVQRIYTLLRICVNLSNCFKDIISITCSMDNIFPNIFFANFILLTIKITLSFG